MDISRTLNASEVIARGCAIQSAMLSPLFKVAEYGVEEANYYPIRCSWLFLNKEDVNMNVENDSKNNVEKQTSILFPKGCTIPSIKAITFHKDEPLINFKLTYDPCPPGVDPLIANYTIQTIKPKEPEFGVKIRVQLNKNGIVEFDSAQLLEDYYEEVPAKEGEKKEGGDEIKPEGEEAKKKKKTKTTNLATDVSNYHALSSQQISSFAVEENTMNYADRLTSETYEKKNQLESYIYETRAKLNDTWAPYVHSNVKQTLLNELEKAEQWLYGEGAKTTKEAYMKKIDDLNFLGGPIERRFKEYETVPEAAQNFLNTLMTFEGLLVSNVNELFSIF
jgi:heat shock protein 4